MIPEVDTRDAKFIKGKRGRQKEIVDVAGQVSKVRGMPKLAVARLNPGTATVAELRCSGGSPSAEDGLTRAAQDFAYATRSALGAGTADIVEFAPDPVVQRTSTGAAIVQLRQMYRGIPVFQMTRTVTFAPDRRVMKIKGNHAPLPANLATTPVASAVRAVQAAGRFVAKPGKGEAGSELRLPEVWTPKVVAAFALPSQPTVLDAKPFDRLTPAQLIIFYEGPGARLGWYIQLTFPPTGATAGEQCEVVVGGDKVKPKVLFCRRTAHPVVKGDVFERDPSTRRARVAFPVPGPSYDLPVPPQKTFPKDWCYIDETDGRNARAIIEKTQKPARATRSGSDVLFVGQGAATNDQRRINSFYFCNYLHDFFELLGFDEQAGNFEAGSATPTGAEGDPVVVVTHARSLLGFAYMAPSPDGSSPTLGLGFYPDSKRHAALDFTVVAHEYTHGVTQRLVGGPGDGSALTQPQSAGFAEGTSDLFALSIVNFFRLPAGPELQVIGEWFTGSPKGLRGRPYDPSYRGTYGKLGKAGYREPHQIGGLWCATMMEFMRGWYGRCGKDAYQLCWRIILDALKAVNAPPSLLDARDALEDALDLLRQTGQLNADDHKAAQRLFWETFARFGMGFKATTIGPSLKGIKESFEVPSRVK